MLMLRFLLVWAIVSCGVEGPPDYSRYRIDVEGLAYGEHVYLGTKLTGISVKVQEFLSSSEYDDDANTFTYDVKDKGVVTSGSLQIDIECQEGEETFKAIELDVTSETTKIPEIELASDNFRKDSCNLIVAYDDGATNHHGRKLKINFRIISEDYCLESEGEEQPNIFIGKAFEKKCAKQTFELAKQCGDDLQLFYYAGEDTPRLLSKQSLDNDRVVIVSSEVDDNWSIPQGCTLKINNRDYALTKPSAGQNIAQSATIKSVSNRLGMVSFDSDEIYHYLTVGKGWYQENSNDSDIVYPADLRQLAIMTHKEGWWSYLAGPNVYGINESPLTAGQPIIFKDQPAPPPENCPTYLYNNNTLADYTGQQIGDNSYLFTTSACTFKVTNLGVIFDVPVADNKFVIKYAWQSEGSLFTWGWNSNTVTVIMPTEPAINGAMAGGVGGKVWIYTRVNTRSGGTLTSGDWQVINASGSDWGAEVSQTIADNDTQGACATQRDVCGIALATVYDVMIRVERNNQSYWFDIF